MEKTIVNELVCMFGVMLLILNLCRCESEPEVKSEYGRYIGSILKTRNGRDIFAYQGIPFAKPPVGNLRFQEPMMVEKTDEVYNATTVSSNCFQESFDFNSSDFTKKMVYGGNEDCLYLNVYVPKLEKDMGKLPVMFFIHGGGYIMGSGSPSWNGPAYLLDRDIIMVTTNYRLSVLGFLSVDDELPENLGMKDQYMALKWVKENIGAFGGDPDSITVAGLSAGSSSASIHMHSPLSRGLFQRAIAMSGTIDCPWAFRSREEARKVASKIVKYLGCSSEPKLLLRCLQKMPVNELFDAVKSLKVHEAGIIMPFGPVAEKESPNAFLTEKSIEEASNMPLLTGVTSEEGIIFYNQMLMGDPEYANLTPLQKNYSILLPIMAYYSENSKADDITEKLVKYYIGDKGFNSETIVQFVKLLSDTTFNHGLHSTARKHQGKLYQYMNTYYTNLSLFSQTPLPAFEKTSSHGDDMMFLFNSEMFPVKPMMEEDLKFSNFLIDLWTNFVRFGDPTPDSKLWKETDDGKQYLELSNDGHKIKTDMFKDRMEFLDSIGFDKLRS